MRINQARQAMDKRFVCIKSYKAVRKYALQQQQQQQQYIYLHFGLHQVL